MNRIRELAHERGVTVVLSTHLLPDVEAICDEVVVIAAGKKRRQGRLEDLRFKKRLNFYEYLPIQGTIEFAVTWLKVGPERGHLIVFCSLERVRSEGGSGLLRSICCNSCMSMTPLPSLWPHTKGAKPNV